MIDYALCKPTLIPLVIYQAATFSRLFIWKVRGGSPETIEPVNLVGCTAWMEARRGYDAPEALFRLTTENGGIVLGGEAGTIRYHYSNEATAALIANREAIYDTYIRFPDGTVIRRFHGPITVDPTVSR